VLLTAAPAYAIAANHGLGTDGVGAEDSITFGRDFGNVMHTPNPILCFEVTENTNTVHFGNNDDPAWNATDSPDTATYTKQTDLTWSITQTMFVNPDGAFSAALNPTPNGTGCDYNTIGDPIAATATVTGDTGPGSITCSSGEGEASYSRTGDQVTVTWQGTCTIVDDAGGDPVTTPLLNITYTGTETPCITPPNSCENSTLDGTLSYEPV
jgi:hypothetical protein